MNKVLKFSAAWCGPCKSLSRVIEKAGDKITCPVEEIDIDVNPELAKQYQIRGVPTLVVLNDDGIEIARRVGLVTEPALIAFLAS